MRRNFEFKLGNRVEEKATEIEGTIVMCGYDEIGNAYEVSFAQTIMGRRRHWKREGEIRLVPEKAPISKKKKTSKKTAG